MESDFRLTGTCVSSNTDILHVIWFNIIHFISSGGLSPGDIVTHINRRDIKTSSDVYEALGDNSKTLELTIFRGLKRMTITITPEDP